MFYTYILRSISQPEQRYIGSTADLKSRLAKHNAGEVPHTSKFKPWKVEAYFAFETKEKAIITINEYDKVVNYADEQLKTYATDLRNAICEDDSSILVERNVPIMYLLISKLEDAITKVIRGLYNLLAIVKEDVSLSKAELESIIAGLEA